MRAAQLLSRDFDVVDGNWSVERIRETVQTIGATWIIVRQHDQVTGVRFFAFAREALLRRLASSGVNGATALGLARAQPSPVIAIDAEAKPTATPQVVLEDGVPAGILAPLAVAKSGWKRRGGELESPMLGMIGSPPRGNTLVADAPALTRYMTAELPTEVVVHESVSLLVSLDSSVSAGSAGVAIAKPAGTKVDIVIKADDGLTIVGRAEGTLEVSEPQLEQRLQFKLRAERAGTSNLRIYAFSDGVSLAMLRVTTTVVVARTSSQPVVEHKERIAVEAVPRRPPDLSLFIFETGNELSFRLSSADGVHHMQGFDPVVLRSSPADYFSSFFQDIEDLPLQTPDERSLAAGRLAAKGATLFDAVFPAEMKVLLWGLRERIDTVQITSDEPWIPWELCQLTGETDGRLEDGPFFAEAFEVTRWLPGAAVASSFSLNDIALVVPGDSKLPLAEEEGRFVASLASTERRVTAVPARYAAVKAAMSKGSFDAWHFTGHARGDLSGDANRAAIELENREALRPEDISGSAGNLLVPRPFIFLNACQSAQAGLSLTGPGGWAKRFLSSRNPKRTASGFIGSYWSVYDDGALKFAKAFYTALLDGKPVGAAGKTARLAIRADGDPTWLAYTIYADPYAKISQAAAGR